MTPEHASVMRTLSTVSGEVSLIVSDDLRWRADALAMVCEAALANALVAWGDDLASEPVVTASAIGND